MSDECEKNLDIYTGIQIGKTTRLIEMEGKK